MTLERLTQITSVGITSGITLNNATLTGVTTIASLDSVSVGGTITAVDGNFSGNITAVGATFSGNVSIAGTLTYEDVTNIDSIGIITARDTIDAQGNVTVGAGLSVVGVSTLGNTVVGGATTELVVGGDARITGILTVGSSSITIDGTTNTVSTSNLTVNGTAYPSAGPLSNRNLIINGAMQVAQRGTSSTSEGYQTVDRFPVYFSQVSITQSQQSLTSGDPYNEGFRYFMRLANTGTTSATNSYVQVDQRIEAQNIAQSGWNYVSSTSYITCSFWARSSLSGTYYVQYRALDTSAEQINKSFTLTANTWKKVTHTIPGNSNVVINNDNEGGFQITVTPYYGTDYTDSSVSIDSWYTRTASTFLPDYSQNWANTSSATFDITGVQLEVGSVATPFEHRSYGQELALCQRYYKQILALQGRQNQSFFVSNYGNTNAVNIIEAGLYDMRASVNTSLGPTGNTGNVQYYSYGGAWTASTLSVSTIGLYPYQQIYLYATADGDGRGKLLRRSGASDPDIYVEIIAEL